MLEAHIFTIVMCSSQIDPLIIMQCPSLSLSKLFIFKSILPTTRIINLASREFYLHAISVSIPLLSVCMCPQIQCGSLVEFIFMGLVFISIQPVSVFQLEHLIFLCKVIIKMYVLIAILFSFEFVFIFFSSLLLLFSSLVI